eukprot:CAMPEP_0197526736 /NCGR_PEP_ID=MMETSP1318-20131121/19128_1 /TAXON_ID=552666 /ORGANISM="Partenskyella glossopodia, Strain RCC365" /LENGTH=405 /DNA_ID=CAMNT_0043081051 /DNA_START=276 /DNA_END=1493 /DNA_ORIENTATION=-
MAPVKPEDARALIEDVFETMNSGFVDTNNNGFTKERWRQLTDAALEKEYQYREEVYAEIRSMLEQAHVDEYTTFLDPDEVDGMTKYDISGVGINLVTKEQFRRKVGSISEKLDEDSQDKDVFVLAVLKDSAASQAGLELGDQIIAVDGASVRSMPPFEVLSRIQGQIDDKEDKSEGGASRVEIKFRRAKDSTVNTVQIPRAVTGGSAKAPVETAVETDRKGVRRGVITLSEFNSKAAKGVEEAVLELEKQGIDQYILDLRYNLGGVAQEAVEIAGMFMGGGKPVTYTVSNTGELLDILDAEKKPLTTKPLIVRVNFLTASASEILAGALQDNCRAVLVGTRTFGKGVIQGIFQFSDGSGIKLTIGKYLTPRRKDINKKGIQPDFFLMPRDESKISSKLNQCYETT